MRSQRKRRNEYEKEKVSHDTLLDNVTKRIELREEYLSVEFRTKNKHNVLTCWECFASRTLRCSPFPFGFILDFSFS